MQISTITNLPSTVMDSTYKGRTLSELVVLVGTVVSALLTILNHYHHNTGHRNYCLAVTFTGFAIYFNLRSLHLLGSQNERMEKNLDRFTSSNEEYASLNTKLGDKVDDLNTEVKDFKAENENFRKLHTDYEGVLEKLIEENTKNENTATRLEAATAKHEAATAKQETATANLEKQVNFNAWKVHAITIFERLKVEGKLSSEYQQILDDLKKNPHDIDSVMSQSFGTGSSFVNLDNFKQTQGQNPPSTPVGAPA